ncbi:hypothetical protein QPK32_01465 [Massilia sp. YIM B02763]|uniref:hypothetical protein n=1 Tax=Massilia sp. YIM B02763 TaxID=3050130 RepID=UPI0025B630FD|nr:hypothetical protein [Massilia sp. YIM B02763]MDN4051752.1 hypothetical protein [Massilia sp. YIM B02763]
MNQTTVEEATRFGDAVAAYLRLHRHELKNYAWPLSPMARKKAREYGLPVGDEDGGARATQELRKAVAQRVREVHGLSGVQRDARMAELCGFVIRVWGGLASNSDDTIEAYSRVFLDACPPDLSDIRSPRQLRSHAGCGFPFKGISSWSKWLNFVWSDWALIYDARIGFALNAIHFREGVDARAFRVPDGRDALLSKIDTQSLAALGYLKRRGEQVPGLAMDNKKLVRWMEAALAPAAETYEYYLLVMQRTRDVLDQEEPCSLVEAEMLLFYLSNRQLVRDLLGSLSSSI